MRRFVLAFLAAFATTVILGAQPAWAHTNICDPYAGNSCDAEQDWYGSYVDLSVQWCITPAGYTAENQVIIGNYYGNGPAQWRIDVYDDQGYLGGTDLGYVDYTQYDGTDLSFIPKQPNGDNVYIRVEMDPDVGFTVYRRVAAMHYPGHSPYVTGSTRSLSPIGTWSC